MQRPSIARSLRIALIGLTLLLAVIAALGVASLYHARQRYEDTLGNTAQLATAAAEVATASVVLDEVRAEFNRAAPGRAHTAALVSLNQTMAAYDVAAKNEMAVARGSRATTTLVRNEINAPNLVVTLRAAATIQDLEHNRQTSAQRTVQSQSRDALILIAVAGLIALLGSLALVASLIRSMRDPIDSLLDATQRLAAGDLDKRTDPSGPTELRDLALAFNAMADDLQQATTRLEQERSRLATTIASLGDGLLVTEPGSTVIAQVNPRAEELVPELLPGTKTNRRGSPLPALKSLDGAEVELEHRGRTLSVTAAALGSGHSGGTVWTVRDVTERARLERAKSEFIATASHELRSPLTSIQGFVELLAASPAGMDARQQEFVSIILRSSERLVLLVDDMLDIARFEADHVEMTLGAVEVSELVNELIELMGARIAEKQQTLRSEAEGTVKRALADPSRLRQIIANLLTNAHLYTPEGGEIVVRLSGDDEMVKIAVSDNGAGIADEQLERIFDRFYRGGQDRSSRGTGLGLSIVKSLVELHQGTIEVSSEPGAGTTFTVLIPAASPTTPLAPSTAAVLPRTTTASPRKPRAKAR
jgi:signal transduction histidine kinase